jgi:hypothetical protein
MEHLLKICQDFVLDQSTLCPLFVGHGVKQDLMVLQLFNCRYIDT